MKYTFEIPGFDRDDLELKQVNNLVKVKGKSDYGELEKYIKLPTADKVKARVEKGILTLRQEQAESSIEFY